MTPEQEKLLKRVDHKLTVLLNKERHWVKVGAIQDITGWDKEKLRKARENGTIEYRNIGNGLEYCIESIPEIYIKTFENKRA